MHALIIKNVFSEGPGTIGDYLHSRNIPFTICELNSGDQAPSLERFTHLLVMGGPMAVYEMERYPYLAEEARLIDAAIKSSKRVMGVCLGAQMLAHVLGARVYAGGKKEIGWCDVALTKAGMEDPCMQGLSVDSKPAARVFQWHGDTFDLPQGAMLLASSELYPNQAFRYGDNVYALQFHIEVTPAIVRDWLAPEQGIDVEAIIASSENQYAAYRKRAEVFYERFFSHA